MSLREVQRRSNPSTPELRIHPERIHRERIASWSLPWFH